MDFGKSLKPWLSQSGGSGGVYRPMDEFETEGSYELEDRSGVPSTNSLHPAESHASRASSIRLRLLTSDVEESNTNQSKDPKHKNYIPARLRRWRWQWERSGWRAGVMLGACTATLVLILNVVVTAWSANNSPSYQRGIVQLMVGPCSAVRKRGTWLHVAINLLSTTLLGASNYAMQCLSAPTRKEVDRAHSKGQWVDIGIPSVKNFRSIHWTRLILWCLLALSSAPLHLLYNSAVFEAITANEYYVFVVSSNFFDGVPWNQSAVSDPTFIGNGWTISPGDVNHRLNNFQRNMTNTKKMSTNASVISTYSNAYLTNRADLLMVSYDLPDKATNSSLLGYTGASPAMSPYGDSRSGGHTNYWLCQDYPTPFSWRCNTNQLDSSNWTFLSHGAEYFLSEQTDEQCELLFSHTIMTIVIICNLIKAIVMLATCLPSRKQPLVTTGDAAASFLDLPDPSTKHLCLLSKRDVGESINASTQATSFNSAIVDHSVGGIPNEVPSHLSTGDGRTQRSMHAGKAYHAHSYRWYRAVKAQQWFWCITLCVATLVSSVVLLRTALFGLQPLPTDLASLWRLGFGSLNANALVSLSDTTLPATAYYITLFVLLANSPQLVFSFLYLLYNATYTSMLQGAEWAEFASKRKPLRVTSPKGEQRTTYYLELPYRYAVPLMAASALMHWLMSQSIFLAMIKRRTVPYDRGDPMDNTAVTCGYSVIPIVFSITLGGLMLLTLIMLAIFRRLPAGMPLLGNCSAVISAACHRPKEDMDAARLPVQWGVIGDAYGQEMGHCTLTSMEVTKPIEGQLYAGHSKAD